MTAHSFSFERLRELRLGPGVPIPVRGDPRDVLLQLPPWIYRLWRVQDALNAVGDAMVTVRWDWPA